jgi:hypothetical protein
MYKTLFTLMLLVATLGTVYAQPESIALGPFPCYLVSFDPGLLAGTYTMNAIPEYSSETFAGTRYTKYAFYINTTNGDTCRISIGDYQNPIQGNGSALKFYIKSGMTSIQDDTKPIILARTIDNKSGMIGCMQYLGHPLIMAEYPVELSGNGTRTITTVISSIPWDKGTSSIVDTLHVRHI